MAGSSIGTIFKITTWGESHGSGIGVVVDGCPAGLSLSEADIQPFLDRRKPGQNRFTTQRAESDQVHILSGVFEGRTTGTPISMMVYNEDQRSKDYGDIASYYRPGHADFTFDAKYGFRDYRGGGRSSGRETTGRVAAGAIACLLLGELGISLKAYVRSIGPVEIKTFDEAALSESKFNMPDADAEKLAEAYLLDCMREKNSCGSMVECIIHGVPAGVGDPVFEKLDANLAKAVMSVGAVKGIEIGDGFSVISSTGLKNNDAFALTLDGHIKKLTNHAGGILGGISDGSDIVLRAAIKPTPSISARQDTVMRDYKPLSIEIGGRHDPIIGPRAAVVIESMAAITVLDAMLVGMSAKLDDVKSVWRKK